jgi:Ca2+-binding EF-hand superfamily protein
MKRFFYAAGLSLVLAGAAAAQPAMPPMPPMGGAGHEGHPMRPNPDANGDGKVTLAEFQQSHWTMVSRLDTNGDGKITDAEFMARPAMMDPDGPPPTPKDGKAPEMKMPDMKMPDMKMGHGHGMMMKMRAMHQGMMFDAADVNDDGVVTRAEVDRMTAKQFKRMDENHDGVLSGDELPKPGMMHKRMHGKGGPDGDHGPH